MHSWIADRIVQRWNAKRWAMINKKAGSHSYRNNESIIMKRRLLVLLREETQELHLRSEWFGYTSPQAGVVIALGLYEWHGETIRLTYVQRSNLGADHTSERPRRKVVLRLAGGCLQFPAVKWNYFSSDTSFRFCSMLLFVVGINWLPSLCRGCCLPFSC